ncbi:MAG: hypothetical protein CL692_00135 [Cellvibrionales bacterium]|nr:hypothetical protein [Cellvibrionales bacterium]
MLRNHKNYCLRGGQIGFTMIELLLVVSILAIVGSIVIVNFAGGDNSVRSNVKETSARFEMEQLRQALLNYKKDNFSFPIPTSTVDLSFLFDNPYNESDSLHSWNNDYQSGWRGPYLTTGDGGVVDIGDDLEFNGSGDAHIISLAAKKLQRAVPDPFTQHPVYNHSQSNNCVVYLNGTIGVDENSGNENCLFDWRPLGSDDGVEPFLKFGRPYLVFDLDDLSKARIVSMGENGVYELGVEKFQKDSCSYIQNEINKEPQNLRPDDLILCLR